MDKKNKNIEGRNLSDQNRQDQISESDRLGDVGERESNDVKRQGGMQGQEGQRSGRGGQVGQAGENVARESDQDLTGRGNVGGSRRSDSDLNR